MEPSGLEYPRVYRVPLGWQIVYYAMALLAGGFFAPFFIVIIGPEKFWGAPYMALVLLASGIYLASTAAFGRLTLTDDAVEVRKAFRTFRMRRDDIAYRSVNHGGPHGPANCLRLISKSGKSLLIDMPLDTDDYFQKWAMSLADLNAPYGRRRMDKGRFN